MSVQEFGVIRVTITHQFVSHVQDFYHSQIKNSGSVSQYMNYQFTIYKSLIIIIMPNYSYFRNYILANIYSGQRKELNDWMSASAYFILIVFIITEYEIRTLKSIVIDACFNSTIWKQLSLFLR